MTIFVDSNLLVGGALRTDQHHARARALLESLSEEPVFTTDHVVVESWALLRHRAKWKAAMNFWGGLRHTGVAIEPVTAGDLERAEGIAVEWSDQQFDMVDCTSFAVMERVGCRRAASFDRDFAVYRFGPNRRWAFEIVT